MFKCYKLGVLKKKVKIACFSFFRFFLSFVSFFGLHFLYWPLPPVGWLVRRCLLSQPCFSYSILHPFMGQYRNPPIVSRFSFSSVVVNPYYLRTSNSTSERCIWCYCLSFLFKRICRFGIIIYPQLTPVQASLAIHLRIPLPSGPHRVIRSFSEELRFFKSLTIRFPCSNFSYPHNPSHLNRKDAARF